MQYSSPTHSLDDVEGSGLIVEAWWCAAALEGRPYSIQVLLGVEDQLLKAVGAGHVPGRLEVFPGLGTHLGAERKISCCFRFIIH